MLGAAVALGCVGTRSPFAQTTGDAASALSVAATTLSYVHEGRLTVEFGKGMFEQLRESVAGITETLPQLEGRPDQATVDRLVELFGKAQPVLDAPCFEAGCEWTSQLIALKAADDAFMAASEQASGQ